MEINTFFNSVTFFYFRQGKETPEEKETDNQDDEGGDSENAEGTSVFVKNLSFRTTEETLKEVNVLTII